jgi:hypothetical protein
MHMTCMHIRTKPAAGPPYTSRNPVRDAGDLVGEWWEKGGFMVGFGVVN